ncbi:MAG: CPBP family glutamic-type intramembrane protease [Candidatus Hodarchaeales archaeon]
MPRKGQVLEGTSPIRRESEFIAVVILVGVIGVYMLISRLIFLIIGRFVLLTDVDVYSFILGLVIRIIPVVIFFWVNKGIKEKFFIKMIEFRKLLLISVCGILIITLFSVIFAYLRLGTISWLPLEEWPENLLSATYFGIVEELEFCSILLICFFRLSRQSCVIEARKTRFILVIILMTLFFGPIYHFRYLINGSFLILIVVTIFGLAALLLTLKTKSIVPAIVLHIALDFIIFVFIGGTIKQL